MTQRVYFDHAATTPINQEVGAVMMQAMEELFGNPSSIHADGRKTRAAIEKARKTVAGIIGASIGEVFFTSGGTESSNMVLKGAVRDLGVKRIISSPIEHHCVLHSLDHLASEEGTEIVLLEVDPKGRISYETLEAILRSDPKPTLVSLMHANNEIGTLHDIERIGAICAEHGAYFHSDTVQTLGFYPLDVAKARLHFCTGSAHKFHGPKGCGFVYINSDSMLRPFIDGGGQERNMRAGTENVAGILGLAKALDMAQQTMEERRQQILAVKNRLKSGLETLVPGITFNGEEGHAQHYKILSAAFPPGPRTELLLLNLDIAGVSASGGSACSSGADAGSHVIGAIDPGGEKKTIRFSFAHTNTLAEADRVLEVVGGLMGH
ncbi:MAG: cysteine desulfurase [Saprospiraceae bacterium]|nr:cysteine desulfurase [Saprospiraceae bacterium]